MPTIKYSDGTKIKFSGVPTQKDVEEAYAKVKGLPSPTSSLVATSRVSTPPNPDQGSVNGDTYSKEKYGILPKVADFLGVSKFGTAIGRTLYNINGKADKNLDMLMKSIDDSDAMAIKILKDPSSTEQRKLMAQNILKSSEVQRKQALKDYDTTTTAGLSNKEVIGSALNTALLATTPGIPSLKGASTLAKVGVGAGTGYGFDVANNANNNEENVFKPGIGTVVGGATPLVAKVFTPIITRLSKSLASGLSGISTKAIDAISNEAKLSKGFSKIADTQGTESILKKNAETIIEGVSTIRKQAREAYGTSIGELKSVDIDPKKFRSTIQPILKDIGSVVKNGKRTLTNAEFDTPVLMKKATNIINKLSKTKLDGHSLNKTLQQIDGSKIKITGGDANRLAFNAFLNDLSSGVREAIGKSTTKLGDINSKFSSDMQIAETIEDVFGTVKFKSREEIGKVARKLETLFSKKGLDPRNIDDFLNRIGVSPSEFRASEASRQISDIVTGKNTEGLSGSELIRGVTSAVVTPKMVRDLAIRVGLAEDTLRPILEKIAPASRAAFIKLLVEGGNN